MLFLPDTCPFLLVLLKTKNWSSHQDHQMVHAYWLFHCCLGITSGPEKVCSWISFVLELSFEQALYCSFFTGVALYPDWHQFIFAVILGKWISFSTINTIFIVLFGNFVLISAVLLNLLSTLIHDYSYYSKKVLWHYFSNKVLFVGKKSG